MTKSAAELLRLNEANRLLLLQFYTERALVLHNYPLPPLTVKKRFVKRAMAHIVGVI